MTEGKKRCVVCQIVAVLAGVGALNWGLVGLFGVDLVARLLGEMTGVSRAVYILIGVAGGLTLVSLVKCCPCAGTRCDAPPPSAPS